MKKTTRSGSILILTAGVGLLLTVGCAHQPPASGTSGAAMAFFTGMVHGFLMFFNLIASLFTDVRIYTFPNNGFLYDLGYVIGASIFFGGSGAGASRRKG